MIIYLVKKNAVVTIRGDRKTARFEAARLTDLKYRICNRVTWLAKRSELRKRLMKQTGGLK